MKKCYLFLLVFACFSIVSCGGGGSEQGLAPVAVPVVTPVTPEVTPEVQPETKYPAENLPEKFVAVMVIENSTSDEMLKNVKSVAEKAKVANVQVFNLVVNWHDAEPSKDSVNFELLESMIYEIKSRGLLCILRILVNAEGNWQAWPGWLVSEKTFIIVKNGVSMTEITPWDTIYQSAWENFLTEFHSYFSSANVKAQPDAVQITLGGSFGEQVLAEFDRSGYSDKEFTDLLFKAEKWHIDAYMAKSRLIPKQHIVMVNSLYSADPAYEDEVGQYALNNGVTWIESNAGVCFLKAKSYGPDNAKMLKRLQDAGGKIFLEDESGIWACPEVSLSAKLSSRVAYMQELQDTYDINFSAVSIRPEDLDDADGIAKLKAMLGL